MADSYIQLPADSTGKALATEQVAQTGAPSSLAHVQRITLAQKRNHYNAVTAIGAALSTLTAGRRTIGTIWHPSTNTKEILIKEVNILVGAAWTAGTAFPRAGFMTAENATPGGTTITPQPLNRADAASGLTVRHMPAAPTDTGTPVAQFFRQAGANTVAPDTYRLPLLSAEEGLLAPIVLRAGQAEGLHLYLEITATLTTAPSFGFNVLWEEL